ncbi:SPOR domain-containing protein [Aminobacter anthyllidis]|uniref:SPOR domain-containing protein n=1 Tax=Aminobacter anthyllidis TaxID=1035067 RepID=A0A9X1D426_9HYPH|nr:SPOR domain-containing protein [Aminobacter anthyllidis]MBT1154279.1 SPOR domain-containing protein [Aminobacter anthyllidis]
MADRTQLKIADKNDFADEDPFAELTRIMGFDPRQPVVRQDVGAPADRVEPTVDDDFGIDLEKELLGELASDDLVAEPRYEAPAAYAQANEPAAYAPVEAPVAYAPAEQHAREPEFTSDASFDDAVAASFEDFSLEDELLRPEEPAYAAAPAYEPTPEVNFAPEPVFAPEADFDDAVAASFEQDFSMEDELLAAEEPAEQIAAPVSYAASTEVDLDAEFDVALADVDMDFAAVDDDSYAAEADDQLTLGEYQPAEPEVAFSHADLVEEPQAVAAPVAQAEEYDEFERRLQDALRDEEPAYEPAAYEPAVAYETPAFEPVIEAPIVEPEVAQLATPAAPVEDTSLEDELNALLGNMSSQAKALSDPAPLRVVEPVAAETEPAFASSLWAPEQPAEEPAQAYEDTDYATSFNAEVEEFVAAEDAIPVQADAGYSEPSYDHQADIDVSFDDDAFDMALERSAVAEVAEVAAPAVAVAAAAAAAAPIRPLAASRYEQARNWGLGTPVAPRAAAPAVAAQPSYQPEAIQKPDAYVPVAPTYVPQTEPEAYVPEAYAQQAEPEAYEQAEPAVDDLEAELFAAVSSFDDAPDIETVDVPEKAVALADDLDIPELSFEDDAPPAPAYDDLDGEFSNLMNEMNAPDASNKAASSNYASNPYAAGFDRKTLRDGDASQPIELAGAAAAGAAAMYAGRQQQDDLSGFDLGGMQHGQANAPRQQAQADEFDYDPDFDEAMEALPGSAAARPARRGMMIAAIVGAVAVVGGIGAFALSFGGGEGAGAPVIVKADESPIKIKPENPGGATVPNQDSKVYDRVAGGANNGAPAQDKLVTNAEEPVDLAAQDAEANMPENLPLNGDDIAAEPTAKSEERVAQTPQADQPDASTETAAVAPRKVRTMVVRPDGTLVPREEPAPAAVAAAEPTDPAPQRVAEPASEATGTVQAQPALAPVAKPAQSANTPSTAPIAPQRPSEQPVDVVGEVKPDQVAAVAPSAPTTAAASGAWAMQIASQPSEAAAKSTYADLARRYGSVLNGREVSIVKADIAGKGTFWRVRVPAGTRNDAVSLCESYKAAGGNCFVSK